MNEPLIPGGYILLSRKIIESEIFKKPPLYLKVWIYLLSSAQHSAYKGLERGQLYTSIPEIQEACSYMIGYRKKTPTKDQIYNILEWLRKRCESNCEHDTNTTMITTTKATHGLLVNIDKYSLYQDAKNYESNAEHDNEKVTNTLREQRQPDNINKNVKNVKNDKKGKEKNTKKETYFPNDEKLNQAFLDFMEMRKKIKAPMTERAITMMINKINKHDNDTAIQMLENSIINNWKDIYPLKGKKSSFDEFQELGKEWLSERTGIYEDS